MGRLQTTVGKVLTADLSSRTQQNTRRASINQVCVCIHLEKKINKIRVANQAQEVFKLLNREVCRPGIPFTVYEGP